jgi:hypothetical protein
MIAAIFRTLLQPRPGLTVQYCPDRVLVNTEFPGQVVLRFASSLPDSQDILPGKPGLGIRFPLTRCTVPALIQMILRPRAVTEVSQAGIQFPVRAMPDLLAWRAGAEKRLGNENVNVAKFPSAFAIQQDRRVAATQGLGAKLPPALPPQPRLGIAPAADTPHPAEIRYLIQTLVTSGRQPMFAGEGI